MLNSLKQKPALPAEVRCHDFESEGSFTLALRAPEAAKALGISQRSLWQKTKSGEIPHTTLGRTILYPVEALRDWLRDRTVGGKEVA